MQVASELGGQQRQVRLHERLSATLTADTGIGARRVQADLRSAGQHHPVSAETVRVRQPPRHGRRTGEAAGRRVERLVIVAEHRDHSVSPVDRENRSTGGQHLHTEPEALDEALAPETQEWPGTPGRVGPLGHLRDAHPEFLRRQKADITQTRHP